MNRFKSDFYLTQKLIHLRNWPPLWFPAYEYTISLKKVFLFFFLNFIDIFSLFLDTPNLTYNLFFVCVNIKNSHLLKLLKIWRKLLKVSSCDFYIQVLSGALLISFPFYFIISTLLYHYPPTIIALLYYINYGFIMKSLLITKDFKS